MSISRSSFCDCHTLLVVEDDRLVGLVTTDRLAEFLMIKEALSERRPARHEPIKTVGRDRQGQPLSFAEIPHGAAHGDETTSN
jgi:hypothetical protein